MLLAVPSSRGVVTMGIEIPAAAQLPGERHVWRAAAVDSNQGVRIGRT